VPEQVRIVSANHRFGEMLALVAQRATYHPSGYATDTAYPEIHYMPEDMEIDVKRQDITWTHKGQEQHLKLLPGRIYIHPSGYKIRMAKHGAAPSWRLIGTVPEGAFCHKPCTVSGGGKSEISKSLVDTILPGSFYVGSFADDMAAVQAIFDRSYDDARLPELRAGDGREASRPILSPERSLGSVIKLLTPNPAEFTPELQRLAGEHSQPPPGAGVRHQALLPARVGRRLAQPLQRGHHQRRAGPRAQV
jgi:hypothetical protein